MLQGLVGVWSGRQEQSSWQPSVAAGICCSPLHQTVSTTNNPCEELVLLLVSVLFKVVTIVIVVFCDSCFQKLTDGQLLKVLMSHQILHVPVL